MNQEELAGHAEHLCSLYGQIYNKVLETWWHLDLPRVFNWDALLVDGEPRLFALCTHTIPLNNPMVGAVLDDLARSTVDQAAYKAGWNARARARQGLGLVQGSITFHYQVCLPRRALELTSGLGFRVL